MLPNMPAGPIGAMEYPGRRKLSCHVVVGTSGPALPCGLLISCWPTLGSTGARGAKDRSTTAGGASAASATGCPLASCLGLSFP